MSETKTKTQAKTESKTYPSAVYAAAGVGDLAYQQLRRLPELADQLRGKAAELAGRAATLREQSGGAQQEAWKAKANEYGAKASGKAAELTAKIDAEKIRDSIVTSTQSVAGQATALYDSLVTRGAKAFNEPAGTEQATATPTSKSSAQASTPQASATPQASTAQATTEPTADVPAAKPAAKRQPRTK
jgi:heparin binding hemagglutinin HbhA